jgi:hypothetical protein
MLGLGGGLMSFWASDEPGPTVGYLVGSSLELTGTHVVRSLELRHAELLVRLQPLFWRVRPYLEAELGLGFIWQTARLRSDLGDRLESDDRLRGVAVLYGATFGVDWMIFPQSAHGSVTYALGLTTGIKGVGTGPVPAMDYAADAGRHLSASTTSEALHMWTFFIGATLCLDSRMATRAH